MNKAIKISFAKPAKMTGAMIVGTVSTLCIVCTFFIAMLLAGCNKDEGTAILLTVSAEPTYSVQPGEKSGEFDISCYMIVSEEGSNVEQQLELYYDIYSLIEVISKTLKS